MTERVLYSGKAKTLYEKAPSTLIMEFRDDTSRFDGEKIEALSRKGMVNNYINAWLMDRLKEHDLQVHHLKLLSHTRSEVLRLEMIPVELVMRNRAAGSFCRRYGEETGKIFDRPISEFFLKDDSRHDPMISESYIDTYNLALPHEIEQMKLMGESVRRTLTDIFERAGLILVDFKIEFGRMEGGELCLGDEITPDGMRLWDAETMEILDKDRFRKDLGRVVESYEIVAHKLGIELPEVDDASGDPEASNL